MPSITLNFSAPINTSCQVGDTAYYVDTIVSEKGFTMSTTNSAGLQENPIVQIGSIREIQGATSSSPNIIVETTLGYNETSSLGTEFIFFSKDNKANMNSPLGYFASVKFVNDDNARRSELFSVGSDYFESSK